jgi:DNA-binding NarL/FixJ family response regulator
MTLPTSTPIKVLLIASNQDRVAQAGLCVLLEMGDGIRVIGTAGDVETANTVWRQETPDIVLLDLRLDEDVGWTCMSSLATDGCQARMVVLMPADNPQMQNKAIAAGALGLVYREQTPEILEKAIRFVHSGEVWIDRTTTANALLALRQDTPAPVIDPSVQHIATLSERERDIIFLIGEGLKNKDIAARLFISEATVRNHLSSIFAKLHVSDRLELVIFAFRYDLAKLPT